MNIFRYTIVLGIVLPMIAADPASVHYAIARGMLTPGMSRTINTAWLIDGETAVTHAIIDRKPYALDQLIVEGADLDAPNAAGRLPLEVAIDCDSVWMFKKLVIGGATLTDSVARQASSSRHIAYYLRTTLRKIVPGGCADRCNYLHNISSQRAVALLTAMAAGAEYLTLLIQLIRDGALVDGMVEDKPLSDCVCRTDAPELLRFLCRHGLSLTAVPESFRQEAPWFYGNATNCRAGVYDELVRRIQNHTLDKKFLCNYFAGRYPLNINRLFPAYAWSDALSLATATNDLLMVTLLWQFGARHCQQALLVALQKADASMVEWLITRTTARLCKVDTIASLVQGNPYRRQLIPYLQRLKVL
ncbi:hypothetical protein M1466_01305 [Candidatus Dependentiae bacterium]|nr:hypothetical protein [Candidatus Dependentiae bacterium]